MTPGQFPPDLALYVHWPYCARICPYCDFNVVRDRGRTEEQQALIRAICTDIRTQADRIGPHHLRTVFFGGGTPSLLPPEGVAQILDAAQSVFGGPMPEEVSLEANPTDAEAARFSALAEAGVTRLSLGLQALDDDALRFLGRNHSAAEAIRAAELAARLFPRLSVDLIYARPNQTPETWANELRAAIALGAGHLSPYQLTIEQGTAFERAVLRGRIVPCDDDLSADLYETTQATLRDAGFEAYEVSNHARTPADRALHNLLIWRGISYVGVGPGAHGRIPWDGTVRHATVAASGIGDYIARVNQTGTGLAEITPYSPADTAEEALLMGLRLREGLAWSWIAPLKLGVDNPSLIAFEADGLLRRTPDALIATDKGRQVLNRLLLEILASAPGSR